MGFLQNLISKAATNMSEGIQKRVNDGTFNRMAEGVGSGINNVATGMVSIVNMAEKAFGKLKDKAADVTADLKERVEKHKQEEADRQKEAEQQRAAQFAAMEPQQAGNIEELKPAAIPTDDYIARLAKTFRLSDEDIVLYGTARLTAQTALFFANCDGNYSDSELLCVENFREMINASLPDVVADDDNGNEFEFHVDELFEDINRPYTIEEIIGMTHRLVDNMDAESRQIALERIGDLANQIVNAEARPDMTTANYYAQWRSEFGI
ncbi:MAG: hypothetical protein J6X81_01275 [Muribaculaceae bacterium]|nr:hypothetical protein [Muribaculaceae bacterium]